jgi:hypothetical protein
MTPRLPGGGELAAILILGLAAVALCVLLIHR